MIITDLGIEFIKDWERFRPKAYKDQAGIWTIGYGTIRYLDGIKVKPSDIITLESATRYLEIECVGICKKLTDWINFELESYEFDSLVSMSYNIGTQGFKTSTLLRELNKDRKIKEDYFTRWNKVTIDGKLVPSRGLTRRRRTEYRLFCTGNYEQVK